MALTKIQPNIIAVANNVTNKTVGNTTSIPSFTFDGAGVVTSASNVAISGAGITANTVANSAFQTGSVEGYLRGANLDFGMRNRIINGAMRIDQRNAGANTTPAANAFTLDRWQINTAGTGVFSVQQDSSANTVAGFNSSLKVTSLAATTPGSGDNFGIRQQVEGLNWGDLAWGTASAKPVTLSFWVRSSVTGTFGGALENAATTRSYPFTYTINSANTWEYETITIPGDTTGTWSTDNGTGVRLWLSVGTGSTYNGTAGAWAGADYRSATGATQLVNTAGATWYITGVQLEEGSVPTPFEYRHYTNELLLCKRYFNRVTGRNLGYVRHDGNFNSFFTLPALMRTEQPTGTLNAYGAFSNFQSGIASSPSAFSIASESLAATRGFIYVNLTLGSYTSHSFIPSWESFSFDLSSEL